MIPIVLLSVFGIINLFIGFSVSKPGKLALWATIFLALALAGTLVSPLFPEIESSAQKMLRTDSFYILFSVIIVVTAMLSLPLASGFNARIAAQPAEYFSIILFSVVGALMMVGYQNLIMLFVGLEILSVAMYVLTGSDKRNIESNEAALKYFLMGAFATGIFLFGLALCYGASGGFGLEDLKNASLAKNELYPMLHIGLVLMLVGMLFKVSAAPFHFWTADVYQGAPSVFTAYMSTIVKAAGFAALYKFTSTVLPLEQTSWASYTLFGITILTLVIGNMAASVQSGFKRMMAYSSISHAGYMLIALTAAGPLAQKAIIFYAAAYSLATIAAFGVMIKVAEQRGSDQYTSFSGLATTNPFAAFVMLIAMLSLSGIPLTAGFFSKFFAFSAAAQQGLNALIVVAVLMAIVGIYYYFRVIIRMYFYKSEDMPAIRFSIADNISMGVCVGIILILGIAPGFLTQWIH